MGNTRKSRTREVHYKDIDLAENTGMRGAVSDANINMEAGCRECSPVNIVYNGITMGLAGGILMAISDVFALCCMKSALNPSKIALIRSIAMILVTTPTLIYYKIDIATIGKKDIVLNTVKGFAEATADVCIYYAIDLIGMGDGMAIYTATRIIVVYIFSCILLNEIVSIHERFCIVLNILGIVLITRPDFLFGDVSSELDGKPAIGYMYSICCGFGIASGMICVRAMTPNFPQSVPLYFNGICGAVVALPLTILTGNSDMCIFSTVIHSPILLAYLLGMNVTYFICVYCLNRALQLEKAATVTVVRNISMVIAFVAGVICFHNSIVFLEIIGSGLTILSTVIIALAVHRESRREDDVQPLKIPHHATMKIPLTELYGGTS
ncbi:solute carrier family 35 member G1-like [Saccoglossus kowalevskii]